jgi:EAL domain-containing protein (putative c-di-GMP-specific phosphodiesterase class I)
MMSELRHAIDNGELVLHYQPKIDQQNGTFQQVEALVRWNHPRHGLMPPDDFIPLAERTGLINRLTAWVLNEALAQCRRWHDAGLPLGIAVNLSGRTLLDPAIVGLVEETLRQWEIDPTYLTLELTESSIMSDPEHVTKLLAMFRALKVRLSIDDFGTGYSSLSRLRLLPVDEIKIDKSFVREMMTNASDDAIVHSTIQLCRNLGRTVVAEGVEDAATFERLRMLECDFAQGYHIARPMSATDLPYWMSRTSWKSARS